MTATRLAQNRARPPQPFVAPVRPFVAPVQAAGAHLR